ncbi:lymphatic vessel endothelial hyaluronic acid receptor 1 isoform X2 [Rhinoderma darwinii]
MAESACESLGLQLASKAHVEKAKGYGFETCSYGWVLDKIGVIPRIQNNEYCGKNKTGVVTWKVDLSKTFVSAYCFNDSDVRINSCKPELMVAQFPSTAVMPTSGSIMASTILNTETQTLPGLTSRPHVMTTAKDSTTSLYTTRTTRSTTPMTTTKTTPKTTTMTLTTVAQKNERIVFGGLPTTLLILALVFFMAAVVLAVCYIKKYKTHLLFTTKKKKEKESVEAKVFKDTSGAENTKEEERESNGKEAVSPQKPTGNSIEVEV